MNHLIRVIDCGGSGLRRADVYDSKLKNLVMVTGDFTMEKIISFAIDNIEPGTKAIAYATAGVIENYQKIIICPNIPLLNGVNLKQKLQEASGLPVIVVNDMETAVTGMAQLFPQLDYFIAITRSTGIGLRVWNHGNMLSDSEGGHMKLDSSPNAPLCGCGKQGCVEAILGGRAITNTVMEKMKAMGIEIPPSTDPCKWLDDCYIKGESWAADYYAQTIIPALALFLANIQSLFRVPAIIWKGSLAKKSFKEVPDLERLVRQEMKKIIINPAWVDDLKFYFSPDDPKNLDSFLGAAFIASKKLL